MLRARRIRNPIYERARRAFFKHLPDIRFWEIVDGFKVGECEFLYRLGTRHKAPGGNWGWDFNIPKNLPGRSEILLYAPTYSGFPNHFFLVPYGELRQRLNRRRVFVNAERQRQQSKVGLFIWSYDKSTEYLSGYFHGLRQAPAERSSGAPQAPPVA